METRRFVEFTGVAELTAPVETAVAGLVQKDVAGREREARWREGGRERSVEREAQWREGGWDARRSAMAGS
jgi:hypothetical protein